MMIPTQEFERLQDFYKGKITQSALLNKAARLATEKHLIIKNPKIPDATAVKLIKPLAREQGRLTKRIRTGSVLPRGRGCPRRRRSHGGSTLGNPPETDHQRSTDRHTDQKGDRHTFENEKRARHTRSFGSSYPQASHSTQTHQPPKAHLREEERRV